MSALHSGFHSEFLGASGTECEQSWPLTQPEQWPEWFICKNGWGKGKDFGLAISIMESHPPTSIIQSHLVASECVVVGQRCGTGPSESLQLPQPLPQSPNPMFRAETKAALTGHKFPSRPQCLVRTGTNLHSSAMPCQPKTQQRDSKCSIPESRGAGPGFGVELWLDPGSQLLAGRGIFKGVYALGVSAPKIAPEHQFQVLQLTPSSGC